MALTIISLRQIVGPGMTAEANQTEQQDGLLLEIGEQLRKLMNLDDLTYNHGCSWGLFGCADVQLSRCGPAASGSGLEDDSIISNLFFLNEAPKPRNLTPSK